MNNVILTGRLTTEPETFMSTNNKQVTKFTLAVARRYTQGQESDFIGCTCFERTANYINQYVHKGYKIAVQGVIQNNSFTDKQGKKQSKTGIVVDVAEVLDRGGSHNNQTAQRTTYQPPVAAAPKVKEEPMLDINPDDLPF